jgi:hypothetical protein
MMEAPIDFLTPGKLLPIGDPEYADWAALSPLCADPDFEGCQMNTGPLNLLGAASDLSKAERNKPSLSQLVAYDYRMFGWRWLYVKVKVAAVLRLLAERPRTSLWLMNAVGQDGRSQVAVARYAGINIITVPISEQGTDGKRACMWRIARPIAFGSDALAVKPDLCPQSCPLWTP